MDYYLPGLRDDLAKQAESLLKADNVVVENAGGKSDADLAIPVFAFASSRQTSPDELAKELAEKLDHDDVAKVEPIGGFVNIWIKPEVLAAQVVEAASAGSYGTHRSFTGQEVVIEHTDPNPFKELHIGHIYSNTVGESLARLHEAAGAKVHRVSYHGDVGLHIAKAVWAMGEQIGWQGERVDEIKRSNQRIGDYYAEGNRSYDDKKEAIETINRKIYSGEDGLVNELYQWGREVSYDEFDKIFEELDTTFDNKIGGLAESESAPKGVEIVKANIGKVFKENEGAVVYEGEQDGLHTRVFITSRELPTYEAKELGLMEIKAEMFPGAIKSIVLTANEVDDYFKVVLAAMKKINPELAEKTVHLSHGVVRLPEGKMSSRSGNVVLAKDLLEDVERLVTERSPEASSAKDNALGAIKYAFLKQNIGGDIIYDPGESVNLEGQTGPYIQYAAVRMQSILDKVEASQENGDYDWQAERALLNLIARYPEVTALAIQELAPHNIAQYSYELAREFNRYYESVPVKDAPGGIKSARLDMLEACLNVIVSALGLLNIPVPKKM